jgi:hypothetical protein
MTRFLILSTLLLSAAFFRADLNGDSAEATGGNHVADLVIGGADLAPYYHRFNYQDFIPWNADYTAPLTVDAPPGGESLAANGYELYAGLGTVLPYEEMANGIPTATYIPASESRPAYIVWQSSSDLNYPLLPSGTWMQPRAEAAAYLDDLIVKARARVERGDRLATDPLSAMVQHGASFAAARSSIYTAGPAGTFYDPSNYGTLPWKHIRGQEADALKLALFETLTLENWRAGDNTLGQSEPLALYDTTHGNELFRFEFEGGAVNLLVSDAEGYFVASLGLGRAMQSIVDRPTSEDPNLSATSWNDVPSDMVAFLRGSLRPVAGGYDTGVLDALLERSAAFAWLWDESYVIEGPERFGETPRIVIEGQQAEDLQRGLHAALHALRPDETSFYVRGQTLDYDAPVSPTYRVLNSDGVEVFVYHPPESRLPGGAWIQGVNGSFGTATILDGVIEGAIASLLARPESNSGSERVFTAVAAASSVAIGVFAAALLSLFGLPASETRVKTPRDRAPLLLPTASPRPVD